MPVTELRTRATSTTAPTSSPWPTATTSCSTSVLGSNGPPDVIDTFDRDGQIGPETIVATDDYRLFGSERHLLRGRSARQPAAAHKPVAARPVDRELPEVIDTAPGRRVTSTGGWSTASVVRVTDRWSARRRIRPVSRRGDTPTTSAHLAGKKDHGRRRGSWASRASPPRRPARHCRPSSSGWRPLPLRRPRPARDVRRVRRGGTPRSRRS